ncbi:MAG: hypothetical protein GY940_10935, partial [bacterium]|nr:hypothetical protein [bacterium]
MKTISNGFVYLILSLFMAGVLTAAEESPNLWQRDTLTGDWGGLRSKMEKKGIRLEMVHTGEMISILSGGLERETVFLDNKDLMLSVDAEALAGWKGAEFSLYVLGNHGSNPSEFVGDLQIISNIDSPNTWKIYEAWYQQNLFGDVLSLKFGLYDLNSEFDVIESAAVFHNSSFGIGPDYSQSGLNGPSIFPTTSLALRVRVQPTQEFYLQAAVLDGVPGDPDNPKGTRILLKEEDGLLIAGEAGYEGEIKGKTIKLALGGWAYTGDFERIPVESGQGGAVNQTGNKGVYLLAESQLLKEKEDPQQGIAAFFRLGAADNRVNQLDMYVGAGLVFTGLIPGRDDDLLGLAVAHASNGSAFMRLSSLLDYGFEPAETALELVYHFQVTP